jgi:SET domain-containing protein
MKKTKIKIDPIKGRGVWAQENIKRGETIEVCHILVFDFDEVGPSLEGYVFNFDKVHVALALGNGSLYNHRNTPNAAAHMDHSERLLYFEARKLIKKGEEITIDYGYSRTDRKKFNLV